MSFDFSTALGSVHLPPNIVEGIETAGQMLLGVNPGHVIQFAFPDLKPFNVDLC